jgi:phosphoglycerate dehydrogenase-like enzyme
MSRVLCTEPIPQELTELCQSLLPDGVEFGAVPTLSAGDFARMASDTEFLLVVHRQVDDALLAMAPNLRLVQRCGIGYDNIDVQAVVKAGLQAAYAPAANSVAVAEHTVMLMLVLVKHFMKAETGTRAGGWPMMEMIADGYGDLDKTTVGLIGLGNIGQAVAERLLPFGLRLLYHTRNRVDPAVEKRLQATHKSLPELLEASHIVSLHLPSTEEAHHIMGANQFTQMPPGSFLVNTSRGALVDENALRRAIESGHLAGAGLDTVEREEAGGNPFIDLPNVIVTPHTAGASRRGVDVVLERSIANINRMLAGKPIMDPIPGTDIAAPAG